MCPQFWTCVLLKSRVTLGPRANIFTPEEKGREKARRRKRAGEEPGREKKGENGENVEKRWHENNDLLTVF